MQGFFQVAKFKIPPDPTTHDTEVMVDYIIASRRSRDRAGLRYQRRGIDDDAHVANFVETETIVRVDVSWVYLIICIVTKYTRIVQREDKENVFSYVQIRGSSSYLAGKERQKINGIYSSFVLDADWLRVEASSCTFDWQDPWAEPRSC